MLRQVLSEEQQRLLTSERECLTELAVALARFEAEADDQATLSKSIRQLDELFLLVVVGEFNAGKSAFINALLGEAILEEGVTPTTTRIQVLKHGPRGRNPLEKGLDEVSWPAPLLSQINIVDTPGTNAIHREHESLTKEFVPRSDLVLFVTSADRPFTESERLFLEGIRDWGKKIVVVVNKIDILESGKDRESVHSFVAANSLKLLGFQPEIFAVSARQALRAKSQAEPVSEPSEFSALEQYIQTKLDEKERVRLKLLNPIGVAIRLVAKYLSSIQTRLDLLGDDLAALRGIEDQLAVYAEDMKREFGFRLSDVDNVLHEFEGRGQEFFDDRMRLARVFDLVNKTRMKADYQRTVVADAPAKIEQRVNEVIDWMVSSELRQWRHVTEHLSERRARHAERIVGKSATAFDHDRSRLVETVGREAQRVVDGYDRESEANRMAEGVQMAVAGTALVEVGAIGLGTIVTLIATSTLADVTGIVAASAMAVVGLFVIPARRRKAKRELREKISAMRARLTRALKTQFESEQQRSLRRIDEAVAPYSRFVRAEQGKLVESRHEFSGIQDRLKVLKAGIEEL